MEVFFDRSLLPIDDIAISDSSQRLLTLGTSTLVRLQDANTNEIVRTFTGLDSVRLPGGTAPTVLDAATIAIAPRVVTRASSPPSLAW